MGRAIGMKLIKLAHLVTRENVLLLIRYQWFKLKQYSFNWNAYLFAPWFKFFWRCLILRCPYSNGSQNQFFCRIVSRSTVSKKKKLYRGRAGRKSFAKILGWHHVECSRGSNAMKQSIKAQIALVSQSTAGQRLFALGIISIIAVE